MASKRKAREDDELEQYYRSIAERKSRKKSNADNGSKSSGGWKIALGVIITLALIAGAVVGVSKVVYDTNNGWRIYDNVSVGDISLGGMTKEEARSAIQNLSDSTFGSTPVTVKIEEDTYTLSPADTGARLDVDALVDAAYAVGRDGSSAKNPVNLDIRTYLKLDTKYIRETVETLGEKYNYSLVQTTYKMEGEQPKLSELKLGDSAECQTLVINLGTPGSGLDTDELYAKIIASYSNGTFEAAQDCSMVDPKMPDLENLYSAYYIAPKDAEMNMKDFTVKEAVYGYGFDLEAAKALVEQAEFGQEIRITLELIDPEITSEELSSILYRDVLSSHSSKTNNNENRNTNVRLACQAVNGTVIAPGQTFSFNNTVGKRTTAKGYKPGPSYINGEVVDTIGGGICQVSSGLYYCAMLADLKINYRECHLYSQTYVPLGMDATVSWGTIDFKFTNTTNYPITIEAYYRNNTCTVRLIGTDEKDYYVKMEYETVSEFAHGTVYREMSANNEKGYVDGDVIIEGANGGYYKTYRCKYSKETDELLSRELETTSSYATLNEVICLITSDPNEDDIPIFSGGITEEGS